MSILEHRSRHVLANVQVYKCESRTLYISISFNRGLNERRLHGNDVLHHPDTAFPCLKAAKRTSIYFELILLHEERPTSSVACRTQTDSCHAGVCCLYIQYSCAHHATKSAIIFDGQNRTVTYAYIYSSVNYSTRIKATFLIHIYTNFFFLSLTHKFFKQIEVNIFLAKI